MSREKIIVLYVGGYSYLADNYDSYLRYKRPGNKQGLEGLLINGKPADHAKPAPGDGSYWQVKGKVKRIQRLNSPRKVVTQYVSNPEFDGVKSPVSVEEFAAMPEDRRSLIYSPEYRTEDVPPTECPFEIHEVASAPVAWPEGAMVRRPEYLAMFKSQWHTLPCYLPATAVLKRLAPAVKAAVDKQGIMNVSFYENIETLHVHAGFSVMGQSVRVEIMRYETKPGGSYAKPPPVIEGENLADLEAKVEAFIASEVKKITDIQVPTLCPCCEQKLPKGKKIYFPSRRF